MDDQTNSAPVDVGDHSCTIGASLSHRALCPRLPELLVQAEQRIESGAERCRAQRAIVEALLSNGDDARWEIELLSLCEEAQNTRTQRLTLVRELHEFLQRMTAQNAE